MKFLGLLEVAAVARDLQIKSACIANNGFQ